MVSVKNMHSTGRPIHAGYNDLLCISSRLYGYIAVEQNNKRHDFDVDICVLICQLQLFFLCRPIGEILTKYIRKLYFNQKIHSG